MKNKNIICPASKSGSLENPFRKLLHNPRLLLKRHVTSGMVVLDIGCGPGLFSVTMADLVGNKGKVIAADIQQEMLDKLKNKLDLLKNGSRIKLHKCREGKIGINEKLDFVLAFYVVHEVKNKESFLKEIYSLMKPKTKFLLIEPMFHVSKNAFEETIENAEKVGFKIIKRPKAMFSRAILLKK